MTRYSNRKRLLRARSRTALGWTLLAFAVLCILTAVIGPKLDAAIGPGLDRWYDAQMRGWRGDRGGPPADHGAKRPKAALRGG